MTDIAFIQSLLRELDAFFRTEVGNRFEIDGADKSEPGDRVTDVDVAVQKYIVDRIQKRCPTDAVYGEEAGYDILPSDLSERCWVIDPLDGTYNFQRTLSPAYAVSIALASGGKPVAAGVLLPELALSFSAEKGKGAFCNGEPLSVSSIDSLSEAKVDVDFSEISRRSDCIGAARHLMENASQVRSTGSTVVALCSIARGLTEVFIHPCPQPWDYAAGKLIVEEAGGLLTHFNGDPIELFDGRSDLIASNGSIQRAGPLIDING